MPTLPAAQMLGKGLFCKVLLVPVERIELPTFGLQNRCTIAEAQPADKTIATARPGTGKNIDHCQKLHSNPNSARASTTWSTSSVGSSRRPVTDGRLLPGTSTGQRSPRGGEVDTIFGFEKEGDVDQR
jgi:hypothetical protein